MNRFLPILVLVWAACSVVWGAPQNVSQSPSQVSPPPVPAQSANLGDENARKAKALIQQAIQALGGQAYLTIRDREQTGRGYTLHHGQAGGGALFWSFTEFPDKERVEITKERDIAELYVGNKGWEITFKGPHPMEAKDLDGYLRRRKFSLDTILRTWINDPGVIFLYEGNVNAAQHPALQVTLINAKNEAVTLAFDVDTHLPVKKSFEWRDPVDKQKNLEEEVYENYRQVSGIMTPYNTTRYFNGDMAGERFLFSVTFNQGLDEAMFDPNSGYKPNKEPSKQAGKR